MRQPISKLAPALAALLVLAVLVVGWRVTTTAQRGARDASDWETIAGRMQSDMTVSHVWLEEHLSGDATVNVERDVLAPLGAAQARCRVLRDGGRSTQIGRVAAVDVTDARREIVETCRLMARVHALTVERLDAGVSRPGSAADQRFDVAFRSALASAERLPPQLHGIRTDADRRVERSEFAAVLLLGLALLMAARLIRRGERRLARVVSEREAVLESAGEGILAVGGDGTIAFANTAAGVLLGRPAAELAGTAATGLAVDEDAADDGRAPPAWLAPSPGWRTSNLRRSDGTVFAIEYTATAAQGAATDGVVVTFRDITARRRRDDEREAELSELRAIRETLVPADVPRRPDLDVATCFVAAESGVAGDFYLVVGGPGETTVVAVGDVSGKGVVAARRAAFVRAALSTFASYSDSPAQLLELVNRALLDRGTEPGLLVTAACVVVEPRAERVTWALAGHPPPLRLEDGTPMRVRQGLPLGIAPDTGAQDAVASLRSGEGFVLFTDGLTEARRSLGPDQPPARLGAARVETIVGGLADRAPRAVVEDLRAAAEAHSRGALADDLCVLAVRNRAPRTAMAPV